MLNVQGMFTEYYLEVPVLAVGRSALRPAMAKAFPAAASVLPVCLTGREAPANQHVPPHIAAHSILIDCRAC